MEINKTIELKKALSKLNENKPNKLVNYDELVSDRTGIIKKIIKLDIDPGLPKRAKAIGVNVSNANRLGQWPADQVAGGHTFDYESATHSAIGEAIERYCGNYISSPLYHGSYNELVSKGEKAINPDELILYSKEQYDMPGFPFVPFTKDLPVKWVKGLSLISGETIMVPASLVYVNYIYGDRSSEPATNFHMFAGIACGNSIESAITSGLLEVIERDATMMWWLSDGEVELIKQNDSQIEYVLEPTVKRNVEWYLVNIRSEFELPVIGALLVDHDNQIAGMGFACRPKPIDALIKAVGEGIQLHNISNGIKFSDGEMWKSVQKGVLHDKALKPYRDDLHYKDSFREDYLDIIDLAQHSQIYLDTRMWKELERITNCKNNIALRDIKIPEANKLEDYLKIVADKGFDVICVDITTPDIIPTGLRVVRIIVPGLIPNGPGGFPFIDEERVLKTPYKLGLREKILTFNELNFSPLPHS
ncbi:YcaO-like family protein [Bacillus sp. JJ1562]|uniref:YcaO-like family protein n=1 Tax=Bacillus sp. JJ1562 TaxID=3122960 RepID=UPI0030038E07